MRIYFSVVLIIFSSYSYGLSLNDIGCDDSEILKNKSHLSDPESLFKLGFGYSTGCKSYGKDVSKGREYYIKAAKMGFGLAQINLGIMYMNSDSGYLDYGKSLRWLRIAEKNGVPEAVQYSKAIYSTIEKVEPSIATTDGKYRLAQSIKNNKKDYYFREDLLLRLLDEYETQKSDLLVSKVSISIGTMYFNFSGWVQDSADEFGPYAIKSNLAEKYYKIALDASTKSGDVLSKVDPLYSLSIFYRANKEVENECRILGELYSIYEANQNVVGNQYSLMRPDLVERYKAICDSGSKKI